MTTGLYEGALPVAGERLNGSSRPHTVRLLPWVDRRCDAPLIVELMRVLDPTAAVLVLLLFLLLPVAPAAAGVPIAGVLLTPVPAVALLGLGAFGAWWYVAFVVMGVYGAAPMRRGGDEAVVLAVAAALGAAPLMLAVGLLPLALTVGHVAALWAGATLAAIGLRALLRRLWSRRAPPRSPRRLLVVGSGPRARRLVAELTRPGECVSVVGHLDLPDRAGSLDLPYLGCLEQLEEVLMATAVDAVLIALPVKSCYAEVQRSIEICERIGVLAQYPADVFRSARADPRLDPSGARPVLAIDPVRDEARQRVKRAVDIVGAAAGLLLLWPLLCAIALAIRLTSRGPVLFVQQRCGRNRRLFPMYKFRTMVWNAEALQSGLEHLNEAPGPVFKIRQDPRVTPLGRLLRRTSLDELPQLVNVLRGDMSLVGPRPLPQRDVQRFSAAAALRRFSVRPGITCLWQVNGRSDLPFEDWIDLDLQYIDGWSLLLDLRILWRTVPAVVRGEGAA